MNYSPFRQEKFMHYEKELREVIAERRKSA
jgi:hypothetical protein